ncbi:MAG: FG-GAP repeat protein [Alphaproteobacteria bacterium]|nr:FG-GAP repeat protein [Alphaproteobacteria bacterium]
MRLILPSVVLAAALTACAPPEAESLDGAPVPFENEVMAGQEGAEEAWVTLVNGDTEIVVLARRVGDVWVAGGDMVLGTLDADPAAPPSAGKVFSTTRWSDRTIPYLIDSSINPTIQTLIQGAIATWNASMVVQLEPLTGDPNTTDHVVFANPNTVNNCNDGIDNDGDGNIDGADSTCARGYENETFSCSSSVGMQGGAQQITVSGCSQGSVVHEVGHAAGLFHEHTRCDRDDFIDVFPANITTTEAPNYVKWCDNTSNGADIGPYDLNSIMHYGSGSTNTATAKILTEAGNLITAQRVAPTAGDIEGIRRMYSAAVPRIKDLDNDGFDDLVIGIPGESSSTLLRIGGIAVLYGTSFGVGSQRDELWDQDTSGVQEVAEEEDAFGSALAVGDIDGDDIADIVIGVPGEDSDAGIVHVLFGSASGVTATGDELLQPGLNGFNGNSEADDLFGQSVTLGDFNGDGFGDLAIGAPGEDTNGDEDHGWVHIIYGSASGMDTTTDHVIHQDTAGVQDSNEPFDRFGTALATGDINGDGFGDLLVSAPDEDLGSVNNCGQVHLFFGSASGIVTTGNEVWNQDSTGVSNTAEASDHFGLALATGDFDGDGRDDVVIGVPDEDLGSSTNTGLVHAIRGTASGLSTVDQQVLKQSNLSAGGTNVPFAFFGETLAVGDFDDDGYDDIAIGAPFFDDGSASSAGAVYIVYGSSTGPDINDSQLFTQDDSFILETSESGDQFGAALAVGDYNADGYMDLAVGIPGEQVGSAGNAGIFTVLYGSATGLGTGYGVPWAQGTLGLLGTAETGDLFGASLN